MSQGVASHTRSPSSLTFAPGGSVSTWSVAVTLGTAGGSTDGGGGGNGAIEAVEGGAVADDEESCRVKSAAVSATPTTAPTARMNSVVPRRCCTGVPSGGAAG